MTGLTRRNLVHLANLESCQHQIDHREFLEEPSPRSAAFAPRLLALDRSVGNVMPSILERIKPPRFPNRTFYLNRFGAKP